MWTECLLSLRCIVNLAKYYGVGLCNSPPWRKKHTLVIAQPRFNKDGKYHRNAVIALPQKPGDRMTSLSTAHLPSPHTGNVNLRGSTHSTLLPEHVMWNRAPKMV